MRWLAALFVMACHAPSSPVLGPSTRCTGIQLEAAAPRPLTPLVTSMRWVDASTLIVFLGGMVTRLTAVDGTSEDVLDIDPTTNGMLVLDVARRKVVREFRGASATTTAPRAGWPTELLFVEGDVPRRRREGTRRAGRAPIAVHGQAAVAGAAAPPAITEVSATKADRLESQGRRSRCPHYPARS